MAGYRTFEAGGRTIFELDFRGASPTEVVAIMRGARPEIAAAPEGSLLTLTLVAGGRFDQGTSAELKEFVKANRPYVRRAAVVGISGMQTFLLSVVRLFSGRDIRSFDTREQAIDWLVGEPS